MMPLAYRPFRPRRHPVAGDPTRLLVMLAFALIVPSAAFAQAWLPGGWTYRRAVAVTHPGGPTLTALQVKVTLPASFDFAHAKPDGSDLRVTASDGTTVLPFHLDLWSPGTLTARLWVKVPSIPAGGTTLHVYYGNPTASSASDGVATYEFFDDFDSNVALGYYPLGPSQTIMVKDQAWETEGPHTLSVVPAPAGAPYPYYGYYGLEDCAGIGMAGSTDLVNWTKFPSNPLFTGGGERWPHVIKDGGTYHMVHTVNWCNVPGIVRRTSTNGTTWSAPTTVVTAVPGRRNQNPNLWHDPNDGKFYFYWFEGDLATVWRIMARSATTMSGLASAPDVELLSSPQTIAAPNMMYRDGTYFLITEIFDTVWKVKVYGGPTPLGPFTVLPGNPILGGDCACMFQHPVGNTVYEYYCKRNGSVWTLDLVQADLSAGRQPAAFIDTLRWTPSGGSWSAPAAMQFDGVNGAVVEGATPWYDILEASYSGTDYTFEAWGRLLEGRIFGIGVRMADPDNGYSINLYDDLDGTDNIYIYQWDDGIATEIWRASVGPISKDTWYKLKLKVGALGFQLWFNDSLRTPGWVGAGPSILSGAAALYLEDGTRAQFDDVRVYKYAAIDPATSVGGESTQSNSPPVAAISAPADGAAVSPAAAVTLTSGSTDAQDPPASLAYRWDVRTLRADGDSVVIHSATTQHSSFVPPVGDDSTVVRYRVIHRATDTQGAADSTAVTVWPEVDLQPVALAVSPVAPVGSDSLTFTFRLRNLGRALAPRTRWRLADDAGTLLAEGDQAVAGLDSALVSVRVAALPAGEHLVRVTADTLAVLTETDEGNNAAVLGFTTAPNTPPVAAIVPVPGGPWVSPAAEVPLVSASSDTEDPTAVLLHRWDVRTLRSDGDSVVIHTATTRNSAFTPPVGDDSTIVRYRVVHRVTDTQGASDSTSLTLWPEVDLEPAALAVTPAVPVGTDSLTFTFTLHNRGPALAPRTRWRLVADGATPVAEGDQAVAGLDSALVSVRVGTLGLGTHEVRVTADTLGALAETDESDNAAMLEFTTGPNSTPVAVITAPADSAAISPVQAVALTSGSTDAEDPPVLLAHRWDVRMHTLVFAEAPPGEEPPPPARAGRAGARQAMDGGAGDSVVVFTATTRDAAFTPPVGDDSTLVYFRVIHRVTDLQGLSDSTSIVLFPEVDLEPIALAVTPAEPMGVDSLAFTFMLHNRGGATAPRTRWRLVVDDSLRVIEGETSVPALDSVLVTVPLGPCTLGPHVVRVAADTLGRLRETDEGNNAAMLTFTTGGSAGVEATPGSGPLRERVALAPPYPNPSRGEGASIELALARPTRVDLAVFDVSGRLVRRLVADELAAGSHVIRWDGRGESGGAVSNGLYLVRLQSADAVLSRRIMVLK